MDIKSIQLVYLVSILYRSVAEITQTALAILDENSHAEFSTTEKLVRFDDYRSVVVQQNWRDIGVSAVVWEAAISLGKYMTNHEDLILGEKVIELGAGTGVCGLLAAMLGGYVTITDRKLVLEILQDNLNLNINRVCEGTQASNMCNLYSFLYKESAKEVSECLGLQNINVNVLQWGEHHINYPKYDVIIGADIIYLEETFGSLLQTLLHLSSNHTLVLLAVKKRYKREDRFLQMMEHYFTMNIVFQDSRKKLYIYKSRLKVKDS